MAKYKVVRKKRPLFRKKRPYARRKKYLIPRNPQYSVVGVASKTRMVNMCYAEQFALTSSLGFVANYQFLLNSIYDPNYTGGGHQPLGHDQWAQFYKTYKVLGAKITARFFWNDSATVGQTHRVGIILDKDTTPYSAYAPLIEKTHAKCTKILHGNSRDSQSVVCYYSGKKAFGKDFNDHNHHSPFGASPTTPIFANVFAVPITGGSSTDDVRVEVILEQFVVLSDPIDLLTS